MKAKYWLFLFIICAIANVAAEAMNNELIADISKPLLMALLGGFAFTKARENGAQMPKALIGALFFSWLGDVILMTGAFIFGLVAFLVAHIFYIALNLRQKPIFRLDLKTAIFMTPLLLFSGFMLSKVVANSPLMAIPISLYSTILCALFYTGLMAQKEKAKREGLVLMLGISLFIISDGMIALNKFITPFEGAGMAIMATYIIAQYLLVTANLQSIDTPREGRING